MNIPCTYRLVGEINGNLAGLHGDPAGDHDAVHRPLRTCRRRSTSPAIRRATRRSRANFGRALGELTAVSPYTGQTDQLGRRAGRSGRHEGAAHGHRRSAADADAGAVLRSRTTSTSPARRTARAVHHRADDAADHHVRVEPRRHQPEIATTWLGIVGPGVKKSGDDDDVDGPRGRPADDAQPASGLQDTYIHDGRVLTDQLYDWAVPPSLRAQRRVRSRGSARRTSS